MHCLFSNARNPLRRVFCLSAILKTDNLLPMSLVFLIIIEVLTQVQRLADSALLEI